jgi:hypothetical protein
MSTNGTSRPFGSQGRPALGPQPWSAEIAFERAADAFFAAGRMARDSAKMAARLAKLELENTHLRQKEAESGAKAAANAEARSGDGDGEDANRSADASGAAAVERFRERQRARRKRRRQRKRGGGGDESGDGPRIEVAKPVETPADAADENRDAPTEAAEEPELRTWTSP